MQNERPITLVALDHVVLRTTDLAKMLHFYQHILGCRLERELADLGLTQLRAGSALIDIVTFDSELGKLGGSAPRQDGRNMDHFCLQVAPFVEQEMLTYLSQQGVKVSEFVERYGAEGFGRSLYIEDPEGNVVEIKPVLESGY